MSLSDHERRTPKPQGFALVVVFLLLGILVAASAALLSTTGRGVFFASRFHEDAAARQAAEAGLAHAMATLEADPDFSGTIEDRLTHSNSSYRVGFTTSAPGPQDSVNNLLSSAPIPTSETPVPPRTALVVSRGVCRGSQVVMKALVGEGEQSRTTSILASNRIQLFNKIQIRGSTASPPTHLVRPTCTLTAPKLAPPSLGKALIRATR